LAIPGPGPYVAAYVANEDAAVDGVVVAVEVAVSDSTEAGRNAIDDSDPDGGLPWFAYTTRDGTAITFTLAHGTSAMIDLAPFSPQFIRFRRTDGGATAKLSAWVSSFGPN
jgi:hypothetical protein